MVDAQARFRLRIPEALIARLDPDDWRVEVVPDRDADRARGLVAELEGELEKARAALVELEAGVEAHLDPASEDPGEGQRVVAEPEPSEWVEFDV